MYYSCFTIFMRARESLPDSLTSVLEEGINLYKLHTKRHGRMESTEGSYAKEWAKWEKQLRETFANNASYLNSVQVPFESAVSSVMGQLKSILSGDYVPPSTERGGEQSYMLLSVCLFWTSSMFSVVLLVTTQWLKSSSKIINWQTSLRKLVTLAHKRSHGVAAVANYGQFLNRKVDVGFTALLFSDSVAALDGKVGSVDGKKVIAENEWPHVTLWTAPRVTAKEANILPQLVSEGKASRIEITPPAVVLGEVEFF